PTPSPRTSRRRPPLRIDRRGVADLQRRPYPSLAPVLVGDFGLGVDARRAFVERGDQVGILLLDDPPAYLAGAGELAVVGVELLVKDQEASHLAARQHRVGGEAF